MLNIKKIEPQIIASVLYTIATFIGQGMTFLGIIVFTRIMPQKDYGNYSTYYAYVALFVAFAGANLYCSVGNAFIDYKDMFNEYKKAVLCLSLIVVFVMTTICLVVRLFLFPSVPYWIVIFAAIHAYSFFVVNYGIQTANMEGDYKSKSVLLTIPYFMQFSSAVVAVLMFPNESYSARIIGSTVGIGLSALYVFYRITSIKGRIIRVDYWIYALKISLPSIISSISYMIMQQCDKVMITRYCGADETAVYSVIYYLSYAIIALNSAICPVRQAWIYRRLDTDNLTATKVIQKWYLVLMALTATVLLMLSEMFIMILAPKNYWKFDYIVPFIISACAMVMYGFYIEILAFYKKNVHISICVLLCACINVLLNALMIPVYGAVAACYTTVFAYLLLFILTMIISDEQKKRVYSVFYFVVFMLWLTLMSVVYFITDESLVIRYTCYIFSIIAIGIYILSKKDEWEMVIKK